MHQPYYGNPRTKQALLPWVRLHAIKDYWDMSALAAEFPGVHQTFNYVPSLLLQIEQYLAGELTDTFLELSRKPAVDLTPEEKFFVLRNFFFCHWDRMIRPYPRYWDLLLQRGRFVSDQDLRDLTERVGDQDLLDLQMWFNLTWFGHKSREVDSQLRAWLAQGDNFTESDKQQLLEKQFQKMRDLVPLLRAEMDAGHVELSITPFYHPILPLLVDHHSAREAMPGVVLPTPAFKHPEDAQAQLQQARQYFQATFGREAQGLWPSEGSVSQEVAELAAAQGFGWMATDEGILSHSLHSGGLKQHHILSAEELFKPYRVPTRQGNLSLVFRDHKLSDRVGFVYARWRPEDAVADLLGHLDSIAAALPQNGQPALVSIILDGENAWEHYADNGLPFLRGCFAALAAQPNITCCTVGEYIQRYPPQAVLPRVFAGSWINHNFKIWIGHPEDNAAWSLLKLARNRLIAVASGQGSAEFLALDSTQQETRIRLAWDCVYIAEGSDWYWWYGDDHSSANDREFDLLFREHIKNIYLYLEDSVPEQVFRPIKTFEALREPDRQPFYFMQPSIDGRVGSYYEWRNAGCLSFAGEGGAMHQVQLVLTYLYYGFSLDQLFLRCDFHPSLRETLLQCCFKVRVLEPVPAEFTFAVLNQAWRAAKNGQAVLSGETAAALDECFEAALPFSLLDAPAGAKVSLMIEVWQGEQVLDSRPQLAPLAFEVPNALYEADKWYV